MKLCFNLCRLRQFIASAHTRTQHIFNKNPVPLGRIIDHYVRHRADELAVLDDGRSAHECGQEGTTVFNKKFTTKYWLNFCRNSL